MRHEYDHGYHAPWCAACDAESEAVDAARDEWVAEHDERRTALQAQAKEISERMLALAGGTGWVDALGELVGVVEELDALADETFDADAWRKGQHADAKDRVGQSQYDTLQERDS